MARRACHRTNQEDALAESRIVPPTVFATRNPKGGRERGRATTSGESVGDALQFPRLARKTHPLPSPRPQDRAKTCLALYRPVSCTVIAISIREERVQVRRNGQKYHTATLAHGQIYGRIPGQGACINTGKRGCHDRLKVGNLMEKLVRASGKGKRRRKSRGD